MTAVFDSAFEKGTVGASPFSYLSTSGTVSGSVGNNSNRVLIATFCSDQDIATTGTVSITWDSGGSNQAMTLITSRDCSSGSGSIYLFGLINPVVGAKTILASWTGTHAATSYLGAVSVYQADQAIGWQNSGTDIGTSTTPSSTVTTAIGNLAVVGHVNHNAASTVINAGSSAWIDTSLDDNGAQGYLASVSGSSVVSWTLGSSVDWANAKVDVIAVGGYTRLERGIRGIERGLATGSLK